MESKAAKLSFLSNSKQTQLKPQNLTHQKTQDLKAKIKQKKNTMKEKDRKEAPSADLLVCFPSPAHLSLSSKSIYSPARSMESTRGRNNHHHHHVTRSNINKNNGQASPQLWAKTRLQVSEILEPTSPKVSCAGQIVVRTKPKPKSSPTMNKKKDVRQLFSCFGGLHRSASTSTIVEDNQEEQDKKVYLKKSEGKDVFSTWYTVLHENKKHGSSRKDGSRDEVAKKDGSVDVHPPTNALLLMRCRSAPSKRLFEDKEKVESTQKVAWVVSELKDPFSKSTRWRRF